MIPVEFIKMLMISNLEDKLTQILIGLFVIVVAYFAWWTTNTIEQPPYRTVLLLERRFRRRTSRSRLTAHVQSTSIVSETESEEVNNPSESNQSPENIQNSEVNKPPEASTSNQEEPQAAGLNNTSNITEEEEEIDHIVRIMDADINEVRQRRLAYYEHRQQENVATTSAESSSNLHTDSPTRPLVGEISSNVTSEEELLMEHNYAERDAVNIESAKETENTENTNNTDSNIRIKLKYLNDELKLVDGRLEEQLGDFKRRHFQLEFSSNKLVRLIFNGQVLQPDTETLQNCGLFDNCVVHCLVHQQRNIYNDAIGGDNSNFANANIRSRTGGLLHGNNNQGRDWDLGNILFALVSIILGSAWYFRYEYAHLYTITATVALVAITGMFTIFLIGVYFPDPDPQQRRAQQHSIPT